MHTELVAKITFLLSQLNQIQEDLINLKKEVIEIEMSSITTSQNVVNTVESLPF